MLLKLNKILQGWEDGWVGKLFAKQALETEFRPQNAHKQLVNTYNPGAGEVDTRSPRLVASQLA